MQLLPESFPISRPCLLPSPQPYSLDLSGIVRRPDLGNKVSTPHLLVSPPRRPSSSVSYSLRFGLWFTQHIAEQTFPEVRIQVGVEGSVSQVSLPKRTYQDSQPRKRTVRSKYGQKDPTIYKSPRVVLIRRGYSSLGRGKTSTSQTTDPVRQDWGLDPYDKDSYDPTLRSSGGEGPVQD